MWLLYRHDLAGEFGLPNATTVVVISLAFAGICFVLFYSIYELKTMFPFSTSITCQQQQRTTPQS